MAFYGRAFIYDGVPSELYGLMISDIDASAIERTMGSNAMDIYDTKIYRRAVPYFYGATPAPVLSFPMSAFSEQEIDADMFSLIQKWLFSSRTYKKLQIDQVDMMNIYFDCILNEPEIIRVGNLIKGFTCTVVCNSPYALKFPTTINYTYTASFVDDTVVFNNTSDDTGDYLYPALEITMNDFGGDVIITNANDNNRIFRFDDLLPNEVITIDCSLQTISSSTTLRRLTNFNKKFLRLVAGVNTLHIQGNVENIAMTTQFVAKKLGG